MTYTPVRLLSRYLPLWLFFTFALPFADVMAEDAAKALSVTRIELARGGYDARFYAASGEIRGFVVFGSGDGGWSYWEEKVSRHMAARGFAVAGVDFNAYAATDYDGMVLRRDFRTLVVELRRLNPGADEAAVFYGGWSMGAEQSLPAAAEVMERAPGLRGLILVAPGARGRFGLRLRDRMGITPTGEGTFGLREMAPKCADLKMVVFHAGNDLLDDLEWSEGLGLDLRRWTIARTFHDFDGAGDEFMAALDEALGWMTPPLEPK